MIGFDYTSRIDPAALKAAGCSVVFRYTTWSGWPKSLTPGEADELHAAGIPVVANFESTADRMRGGAAAGHADAVEARGHLGDDHMPAGLKVWFSADWDVQPAEMAACLDYLHAAADVLGSKDLVGCYGGLQMVAAAADAGFATWQTVAWSGGRWDPRVAARQTGEQRTVGGVSVDVNEITNMAALGAWLPGGTMGIISPAIGQQWPEIASGFPANAAFDNDTALIWADAGARAAALYARQARDAINALAQRVQPQPPLDVAALAAHLAPLLTAGATADQVASSVVAHLASTLAKG